MQSSVFIRQAEFKIAIAAANISVSFNALPDCISVSFRGPTVGNWFFCSFFFNSASNPAIIEMNCQKNLYISRKEQSSLRLVSACSQWIVFVVCEAICKSFECITCSGYLIHSVKFLDCLTLKVSNAFKTSVETIWTCSTSFLGDLKKTTMSSTYTIANYHFIDNRTTSTDRREVPGAFQESNNMQICRWKLWCHSKPVMSRSFSSISICQYT